MSRRSRLLSLVMCASMGVSGCRHSSRHVAVAPPLPPDVTPQMVSVPPPTHPSEPLPPRPVVPTATVVPPPEAPRKLRKTRRAPAATTSAPAPASPAPAPAQTAAANPPANPLGQLSTGGESTGQGLQETAGLLHSLETRFAGIPANVQSEHKTEVEQVKRFLAQADEALKTSDTEGARTLAVKAKVLLDEIQK